MLDTSLSLAHKPQPFGLHLTCDTRASATHVAGEFDGYFIFASPLLPVSPCKTKKLCLTKVFQTSTRKRLRLYKETLVGQDLVPVVIII